jgi:hypothetical protein
MQMVIYQGHRAPRRGRDGLLALAREAHAAPTQGPAP